MNMISRSGIKIKIKTLLSLLVVLFVYLSKDALLVQGDHLASVNPTNSDDNCSSASSSSCASNDHKSEPDLPLTDINANNVDDEKSEDEFDYRDDAEERTRPHYALDHGKAIRLALEEHKIITELKVTVMLDPREDIPLEQEDECFRGVKGYLDEFEADSRAVGVKNMGFKRASQVAANPLLLFRMIRRMVVTLQEELKNACETEETVDYFEVIQSASNLEQRDLPTHEDLHDALLGVLRIHYVYGYNATSQLRLGIIGEFLTNVTLNTYDCLALAAKALELRANVLAYQWLASAELSMSTLSIEEMEGAAKELDAIWKLLLEKTRLPKERLRRILRNSRQESIPRSYDYQEYDGCRGESRISEAERVHLHCHVRAVEPYWILHPVKSELLKLDPPVWLFHDFVGNHSIDYLKKLAYPSLARSGVVHVSKTRTDYSDYRTSMMTWLYDDYDPVIYKLNRRMELLTGLEIVKEGASHALQMVTYGSLGGHYDFHDDALDNELLTAKEGDRIATFLMFLSDVKLGGYTAFPQLGVSIRPEKGSAIFWYSLYLNGRPDKRSIHGGCPVILGSKLVANKWILYNANFLRYSCSLNPQE